MPSTPLGIVTEGIFGIEIYVSQYGSAFTLSSKFCTNNGFTAQNKGAKTTDYSGGSVIVDTLAQIKYKCYAGYLNYSKK